jgi:hypothetical protein
MRKRKPKVIEIPIEKQNEARELFESKAYRSKHIEVNAITGVCCICGKIAQKIVKQDITDADDGSKVFRVEKYCDSCYQRWVVETGPDKDKVLLTATNGKDQLIYEKVDKKSTNSE